MKVREYSKTQTGALASLSASSVAAQQKRKLMSITNKRNNTHDDNHHLQEMFNQN